jgi:hypothetical protein
VFYSLRLVSKVTESSHIDHVRSIKKKRKIVKAQSAAGFNIRSLHLRFLIASVSFISLSNSDAKRAIFAGQEREVGRKGRRGTQEEREGKEE